ncbi:MAG: NYN domain-containing protein [Deltaproteobacteria bacterium]
MKAPLLRPMCLLHARDVARAASVSPTTASAGLAKLLDDGLVSHPARMALANPPAGGPKTVEVIKTEEKGSDVNLASHLLLDAFTRDCDVAVVISNDGDLKEPLMMAGYRLGCTVGIVNPHSKGSPSKALASCAAFYKSVRPSTLAASQFPTSLSDSHGALHKPPTW